MRGISHKFSAYLFFSCFSSFSLTFSFLSVPTQQTGGVVSCAREHKSKLRGKERTSRSGTDKT